MTKKHKNSYCKRASKSKLSLKRRLQSVYPFFSLYVTFLVFEVTPKLSFKGKVVLEASSIIWWFGQCPAIPTAPRLAFQPAGLACGTANPQSPHGRAARGVSSSPLVERKQLCCSGFRHLLSVTAGDTEQDGKTWELLTRTMADFSCEQAPIFPEDSFYNHWYAWLCSPNWDCIEHSRISEM